MSARTVEVEVHLPTLLERAAGGRRSVVVEATTLRTCLDRLIEEHPLLRPHLFDEAGRLREHINVFLNDGNARFLESWDVPLRAGDSVTVLQAVSGG